MSEILRAFTARELTFAVLFGICMIALILGRLMTLRHHLEVVNILLQRIESESKAKNDALDANKKLLLQNTLLLQRDDIALSSLASIKQMVEAHAQEEQT